MANIGQNIRAGGERLRDVTNPKQAAVQGGNGLGPVRPNQRREDAADSGQNGQDGGGGNTEQVRALAADVKNLSGTGIARVATHLAGAGRPGASRILRPGDNVIATLLPHGRSTFYRGSLIPRGFAAGGKYTTTQGKPVRVFGDIPEEQADQIARERFAANVQLRPMNRDLLAAGRYDGL